MLNVKLGQERLLETVQIEIDQFAILFYIKGPTFVYVGFFLPLSSGIIAAILTEIKGLQKERT